MPLFFSAVLLPSIACAEFHFTQAVSGAYYHVDGDKSRSFYPGNEVDYLYEGSLDFSNIPLKDFSLFGNLEYRSTDDKTVDMQSASIERMYMGAKGQAKEILMGDFYQSFSDYSLGNALKGIKLSFGDEKSSRFILLGGVDTAKWEDLWERRQEDSATRRYVWGARQENDLFNNKLALNFNYAGARDDKSYIISSNSPIMVNVFSIDGKYNINQYLSASSEIAQSFTDEDTRDGAAHTKNDSAHKLGLDFNLKDYSLSSVYSRVGTHFNTTGGFSAQDLEALNFDGTWFLPLKVRLTHYLHMDRDNLSHTKTTTTKQLNPGGKFALSLPWQLNWDFGADLRKRFSRDKAENQKTYTYSTNLARDFRILFASLGYSKGIISDRVAPAQERNTDNYILSLDGNLNIKDLVLSWNFSESITHDEYKEVCEADFLQSSALGLRLIFPSTLTFEGRVNFGSNDYYINSSDSNNTDYYFSLSRDLRKDLAFRLSYQHKGYGYFEGDNNYAENFIRTTLSYKF